MDFDVLDLGLIDFKKALAVQKEEFLKVKSGISGSALIICRHYPVITLGRSAREIDVLASREALALRGIDVYEIERGGGVTYHGPGQLTVYPVFDLRFLKKDIHWFLRQLEGVVISLLADFGINAQRSIGATGVWVRGEKICSLGIAIRNWITFHGLSINIRNDDLENFRFIRPCGMDIKMVSLEGLLGREVSFAQIKEDLTAKFRGISVLGGVPCLT